MSDAEGPQHPLDPPSADELTRAVQILRQNLRLPDTVRFSNAALVEPEKKLVQRFRSGDKIERRIRIMGFDFQGDGGFDAVVSLASEKLERVDRIAAGQAPIGIMDFLRAVQITKEDPDWQAAIRLRGITDFDLVQVDPWVTGGFEIEGTEGHRMLRAIAFKREFREDNGYARPIEGLIAHVDLSQDRVVRIEDHGVAPFPPESANYTAESAAPLRDDLRPMEIRQPEGTSFKVDGHRVCWQKWQFRFSMHPTQGLVLHEVGYRDGDRLRPILHRASLAEMVVPYGDTSPMHRWKHVFDAGEVNIGQLANSLRLGCDCLGEIRYFDSTMLGWNGEPATIPNAICMHEEDYGIAWKHTDMHAFTTEVRRQRRLVVSAIHTVGNYEYGFFWYFYLDGTLQMEVKLTGIVGVSAVGPNGGTDSAPLIAPELASPVHQHLFCFRLDFDVDGAGNSVYEVEAEPLPEGPDNPYGGAFRSVARLFERESDAQSTADPAKGRYWKIVNPDVRNRMGQPVAYKLLPGATPRLLAREDSIYAQRARFATRNLWVTAYAPDELTAAGDHPNQHPGEAGLPAYVQQNRPLENADVVVWHTFGLTHVPRPEDWPVMPVEYAGFHLIPVGFFERNPALDVPPGKHCD